MSNELNFNISKCVNLSFNNKIPTCYQINSTTLPQISQHRNLGLLLSHNLSWSNHYQWICIKELGLLLLPLMYVLDFYDIMFFCKALKQPSAHFNTLNFVQFSCTNTRSLSTNKLKYVYYSNNYSHNLYFTRLPKLWNRLPPIDLNQSLLTIKSTIHNYLWHHLNEYFDPTNPCTFHFCCPCIICHGYIHNSNFST